MSFLNKGNAMQRIKISVLKVIMNKNTRITNLQNIIKHHLFAGLKNYADSRALL